MKKIFIWTIAILAWSFLSCGNKNGEKEFSEKNLLLQASFDGGINGVSLELYNDNRYKVFNYGGLGGTDYIGSYHWNNDTIKLENFTTESGLDYNRFFVVRYNEQDSNYWKRKSRNRDWETLKFVDTSNGKAGFIKLTQIIISLTTIVLSI